MSDDEGVALLVIRTARWRTLASMATSVIGVAVIFGVWGWVANIIGFQRSLTMMAADPFSAVITGFVALLALSLVGHSVYRHFHRDTLTLSDKGFRFRMPERARFVRWSDVKRFRVERPRDSMHSVVGWDHHDDALSGNPVWQNPNLEDVRKTTLDAEIGYYWEGGAEAVCVTLEQWRKRYSGS